MTFYPNFSSFFVAPPIGDHATVSMPFSPNMQRFPLSNIGCVGGIRCMQTAISLLEGRTTGSAVLSVTDSGMRYWRNFGPLQIRKILQKLQQQNTSSSPTLLNVERDSLIDGLKHVMLLMALFSDSAACATMLGAHHPYIIGETKNGRVMNQSPLAQVIDYQVMSSPNHLDKAEIQNGEFGPNATLHRGLARANGEEALKIIQSILKRNHLSKEDISYWIIHPGGPLLLEELQRLLGLSSHDLRYSWKVLHELGNVMCVSVYHMLAAIQHERGIMTTTEMNAENTGPIGTTTPMGTVNGNQLKQSNQRREQVGLMYAVGPGMLNAVTLLRFMN